MKIGIISDLHANLPALQVILKHFEQEQCDVIYCLGDNIAIGPYPFECLILLLSLPNIKFVRGNHEEYFIEGIPPQMNEGEKIHQQWVGHQLNKSLKERLTQFPYILKECIEGVQVAFVHYALHSSRFPKTFKPIQKNITAEILNELFKELEADVIFYGHEHQDSQIKGEKHYINVGSSGCTKTAQTHCTIVNFKANNYSIKIDHLDYNRDDVLRALEQKEVPERNVIMQIFF